MRDNRRRRRSSGWTPRPMAMHHADSPPPTVPTIGTNVQGAITVSLPAETVCRCPSPYRPPTQIPLPFTWNCCARILTARAMRFLCFAIRWCPVRARIRQSRSRLNFMLKNSVFGRDNLILPSITTCSYMKGLCLANSNSHRLRRVKQPLAVRPLGESLESSRGGRCASADLIWGLARECAGSVLFVSDFHPIDGRAAREQHGVIALCQICAGK
jgi:hypothetical protein